MSRRDCGFTLVELLVALVVLALLSVAGYRALDAILDTRAHIAAETRKWQLVEFFFARMEQDVAQVVHRPIRDQGDVIEAELIGRPVVVADDEAELEFTRAGIAGKDGEMLPPQRIGYHLQQGTIMLLRWPFPDRAPRAEPVRYPLLEGVREFHLRYLETNGSWLEQWPPGQPGMLPMAVESTLVLASGEKIIRVFALQ